jgi:hypothetical protein
MYSYTFVFGSVFYIFSYFLFNFININFSFIKNDFINNMTYKYRNYPLHRQLYIASNIIKSVFLLGLVINYIYLLYKNNTLFLNWNDEEVSIKNSVIIYMIPDLWSMLITNSTIMLTTVFHHICVIIATIFILYSNLNESGIHISFIFYGLLSSYTFLVNTFLGLRFMKDFSLAEIKFIQLNYSLVCLFNWSWQLYYLFNIRCIYWQKIILVFLLTFWINDDIILIKFLDRYKYLKNI